MVKKQSRSDRWNEAATQAANALEILMEIQNDYREWYDNLNEGLQATPVGQKLETLVELDVESARDIAQEAVDADLPRGFGKD